MLDLLKNRFTLVVILSVLLFGFLPTYAQDKIGDSDGHILQIGKLNELIEAQAEIIDSLKQLNDKYYFEVYLTKKALDECAKKEIRIEENIIEALERALRNLKKSSEWDKITDQYLTTAERLRLRAEEIELRDNDIDIIRKVYNDLLKLQGKNSK